MKIRKTCLAALCALPLALTACGSDDGENSGESSHADEANQADQADQAEEAMPEGPVYETPASDEDKQQIVDLLHGLSNGARPMDEYLHWTIDNTCRADIEQQGGEEAAREQADASAGQGNFDEQPGRTPNITDIQEVMAEGDNAHATVTISEAEREDSNRMYFKREDEKWKFCHAVGMPETAGTQDGE